MNGLAAVGRQYDKKKVSLFFLLIISALALAPLCNCQYDNAIVIVDDFQTLYWNHLSGWVRSNDYQVYETGVNSYKIIIDSGSWGENIYKAATYDLSTYNYFGFLFWGNGSGYEFKLVLQTSGGNYYSYQHFDNKAGWDWISFPVGFFTVTGAPNWNSITELQLWFYGNNAAELTVRLDLVAFFEDYPADPRITAEANELQDLLINILFGDLAFIGILLFLVLGTIAIILKAEMAAFVFILTMIYEVMLYRELDIYGNNIYYMLILVAYAIFCGVALLVKIREK